MQLDNHPNDRRVRHGVSIIFVCSVAACGADLPSGPEEGTLEETSAIVGSPEWGYGWAQAGRSPRRTGYDTEESWLSPANVSELRVVWQKSWAIRFPSPRRLAQAVVWRDLVVVRTSYHDFVAYTADTGAERWAFQDSRTGFYDLFVGPPAIGYGTVFATNIDALFAFGTDDGVEVWRNPPPLMDDRVSDPLAAGRRGYVTGFTPGDPHEIERMKTFLYAYDGASGRRDWVASFPGEHISDPAAANGRLYLALPNGGLVAVAEGDGSTVWTQALPGVTLHSPAVMGGRIFITARSGDLLAFAASDGALLWSAPLAGEIVAHPLRSPVVDGETVYIASDGGAEGGIYVEAFSAADGTKKYTRTVGTGAYTGDLAGANGVLYLGSDDGNLYALDARDGTPLLALPLGDAVSPPAIAQGHVYAGTETGIHALSVPPPP